MAGQPNTRKKPPLVLSTSDVMVTSYVSVFLPAVQQLALEPLLGQYPKAHAASQLRSLRCAPADLITGLVYIVGTEEALWEGVLLPVLLPAYSPRLVSFSSH